MLDYSELRLALLIPLYNDWKEIGRLLLTLDDAIGSLNLAGVNLCIVDDGSTEGHQDYIKDIENIKNLKNLEIIKLTRNLGHQRAIAVGLVHLYLNDSSDITIVMDGDGQDNPYDIKGLMSEVSRHNNQSIVFAERTIRSEGVFFCLFYLMYRLIHKLLTGKGIRFGNFSAIPRTYLGSLITLSELWNHYAASVVVARIPYTVVSTSRVIRYSGDSKMNFIKLVVHGLSAIAVQREVVSARMLMIIFCGAILTFAASCLMAFQAANTPLEIVFLLFAIWLLALLLAFIFVFIILGNRESATFLPVRDSHYFISKVYTYRNNRGVYSFCKEKNGI